MPRDESNNPYENIQVDDIVQRVIDKLDIGSKVAAAIRESQHAAIPEQVATEAVEKPRPWTSDETADQIVSHCARMAEYWATTPNGGTLEERCHGVAFSLLSGLDGSSMNIPPFDLVPSADESDRDYHIENGENYYIPENVVSTALHERYHRIQKEMFPKYGDLAGLDRTELSSVEMRKLFTEAVYNIAWRTAIHVPNKREACEATAYQIMQLLDGDHPDHDFPPFVVTASPSREYNEAQAAAGSPTWISHLPIARSAPAYGESDSLADSFNAVRRSREAALTMFAKG